MDRDDWIVAGSGLLIALMGFLALGWAARAHAAPQPFVAGVATNTPLVDYYGRSPVPASQTWTWDLPQPPPPAGDVPVTLNCFDCENKAEGAVKIGSCGPFSFPAVQTDANDNKTVSLPPIVVPASCFTPSTPLTFTLSPTGGTGYRIMGISAEFPADPVTYTPPLTITGALRRDGLLPPGFEPTENYRVVTYKIGWDVFTSTGIAICLQDARGTHVVWPTSIPLVIRKATGLDQRLQFRPEDCPTAWAKCFPADRPFCPAGDAQ